MKKKYLIIIIFALFLVGVFIWCISDKIFLKSVEPKDISYIAVRNGNTGKNFEIATTEDIAYVVENIQKHSFSKQGISLFHMGTMYTLAFYDDNENVISSFIVNGNETIRKDPFFYEINEGSLEKVIEYLNGIEEIQ